MTIGFTRFEWAQYAELPTDPLSPSPARLTAPERTVWSLLYHCGLCGALTAYPALHCESHDLPMDRQRRARLLTTLTPCCACMGSGSEGYPSWSAEESERCATCLGTGRFHVIASPMLVRLVIGFETAGIMS